MFNLIKDLKCPPPPIEIGSTAVLMQNLSNLALYECKDQAYASRNSIGYSFVLRCININPIKDATPITTWNGTNICTESKIV